MDTPIKGFRYAGNAGILLLLFIVVLSFYYLPELKQIPSGFHIPILALEFSTSLPEATQLFNHDRALIETYHVGHKLNMLVLLLYATLLICSHIGANHVRRNAIALFGIITALLGASADYAENKLLMQLTEALLDRGAAPDFWLLRLFVSIKFTCLTLSMICLMPFLWRQGRIGKLFCLATLPLPFFTLLTLIGYYSFSTALAANFFFSWLVLCAWLLSIRKGIIIKPFRFFKTEEVH